MIADFIAIQRDQSAATEAAELLAFIRDLRSVYERGIRIRAKMRHSFDDANPQAIVWTKLETLWGVPTGNGSVVFTYIDGAVGSMEGTFQVDAAKVITERVG
jgi:hypothetical protein